MAPHRLRVADTLISLTLILTVSLSIAVAAPHGTDGGAAHEHAEPAQTRHEGEYRAGEALHHEQEHAEIRHDSDADHHSINESATHQSPDPAVSDGPSHQPDTPVTDGGGGTSTVNTTIEDRTDATTTVTSTASSEQMEHAHHGARHALAAAEARDAGGALPTERGARTSGGGVFHPSAPGSSIRSTAAASVSEAPGSRGGELVHSVVSSVHEPDAASVPAVHAHQYALWLLVASVLVAMCGAGIRVARQQRLVPADVDAHDQSPAVS